jgi:hypothetical protein
MKSHLKGRKEEGTLIIELKMEESFTLSMVGIKISWMNSTRSNRRSSGDKWMNRNKGLSKGANPSMISSIIDNNSSSLSISRTGNQTKCLKRKGKLKMNTTKNLGSSGKPIIITSETL